MRQLMENHAITKKFESRKTFHNTEQMQKEIKDLTGYTTKK